MDTCKAAAAGELHTPANRDSKAATRGDMSESITSELDGPNEELVHCILERDLAAKETGQEIRKSRNVETLH